MHVVVVGCGRVGSGLASILESQGHSVAVIDKKPTAFRRLAPTFTGQKIVGIGFDKDCLIKAGIERAGALASVTNGDNSNIVVARVAREAFGIERVVARIYDSRRASIYERSGIPTVATVRWTTERVLQRILPDESGVAWIDPSAKVCLVERVLPSHWAGKLLQDLEIPGQTRIVALTRLGVATITTPSMLAQEGDVVWMAVAGDSIGAFDAHVTNNETLNQHSSGGSH